MTQNPEVLFPFRTSGPLGLADFFLFWDYRTLFSFRTSLPYFLFGLADLISFSDKLTFGLADLRTNGLPRNGLESVICPSRFQFKILIEHTILVNTKRILSSRDRASGCNPRTKYVTLTFENETIRYLSTRSSMTS